MSAVRTTSRCPAALEDEAPVDLETAREHLAERALLDGRVGRVGLELERHLVDATQPTSVVPWRRVESAVAGLDLPGRSRVTMEPGGQIELSTPPMPGAAEAVAALSVDDAVLRAALADAGLALLGIGADPARAPVRVHPGDRYSAMSTYFGAAGYARDGALMMCSTAALQVNLEAGPASGWADRVAHVYRVGPVLIAMSSSSPLLGRVATGWQGSRSGVWQRLDPGRCAPFPGRGDPGGAWAAFALAAPVMLVRGATGCEPVREHVPLVAWVCGDRLLDGRRPTRADLDLHLTTLWPPVRLRGTLEVRLLDTVPARYWPGLAAIVTAVLDDPVAVPAAADAAAPVAGRWSDAARLGTRDPALARAARDLVDVALRAAPLALRPAVEAWADLLGSGRSPADLVLARARRDGPDGCLLAPELS